MLGKTLELTSMWQIVPIEDEFFFRWDEEKKPKEIIHDFMVSGDIDSKPPQYL